jgi:hypothetical protein
MFVGNKVFFKTKIEEKNGTNFMRHGVFRQ